MSRCQEFIGVRCIEAANVYGEGQHLYNMHLTDTEIIRCRDCKLSHNDGWKCARWATHHWDEDQEVDVIELADVQPDGFCAWAERRDV